MFHFCVTSRPTCNLLLHLLLHLFSAHKSTGLRLWFVLLNYNICFTNKCSQYIYDRRLFPDITNKSIDIKT